MNTAKILVADKLSPQVDALLVEKGFEVVDGRGFSDEQKLTAIADADAVLVRSKTKLKGDLLAAGKNLKVIGRAGTGVDNIDLKAATSMGVACLNTPGGNSVSVAEHVFGMMLSLVRSLPEASAQTRAGKWPKSKFLGQELDGRVLALLGCGRIGSEVARRAKAFGMRVRVFDPYLPAEAIANLGAKACSLDEALNGANVVSLHLPLTADTKHLMNGERLEQLAEGALVINCARGGLIDEDALVETLKSGRIGGAGLDVFETEPDIKPGLAAQENVVLTPHVAGNTAEAQERVGLAIARQVATFLKDGIAEHAVNLPNISPEAQRAIRPYLPLARSLARMAGRLHRGPFSEVGIRAYGELAHLDLTLLRQHVLAELLRPMLDGVSPFNAEERCQERGISVVETRSDRSREYRNLLSLQLRESEHPLWIEGTHLGPDNDRLTSLGGVEVEAPLHSTLVVIENDDVPGVIGAVGTCLGEHGVNIGTFSLGRLSGRTLNGPGFLQDSDHALGVISVDQGIDDACLKELLSLGHINRAQVLEAD